MVVVLANAFDHLQQYARNTSVGSTSYGVGAIVAVCNGVGVCIVQWLKDKTDEQRWELRKQIERIIECSGEQTCVK